MAEHDHQRQFAPHELADALRRLHGVDVSGVPVNRGPEAATEARALGTRAFTRDGEVFLPQAEGPLERTETRALLAHELTHAAQQSVLGTDLPAEASAAGRMLEAGAAAAERWVLGQAGPPQLQLTPSQITPLRLADPTSATPPTPMAPFGGLPQRVQRFNGEGRDASAIESLIAPPPPPQQAASDAMGSLATAAATRAEPAPEPLPVDALKIMAARDEARDEARPDPDASAAVVDRELASVREQLIDLARQRPLDLDDPQSLDELADEFYQRIHARLRLELLVDRERSGLLSDFR